jgi:hypothetical protein
MEDFKDSLLNKLKTLDETIWERKVSRQNISAWLNNFNNDHHLPVLFLLRQMMYFGKKEIDELLKSTFRDLYKYPIIEEIRKNNFDTTDVTFINSEFQKELRKTRFVSLGNVSESSTHFFYPFRQVNNLQTSNIFISSDVIFPNLISNPKNKPILAKNLKNVTRYIFFDDLCGGGTQAVMYSKKIVNQLKSTNPNIIVDYYSLLATTEGLNYIKNNADYNRVACIFELDDTFKCFSDTSRYFIDDKIEKLSTKEICEFYGSQIFPGHPLGYDGCQLLLAFFHNTPDNSLPIFWSNKGTWEPIFKRIDKNYA